VGADATSISSDTFFLAGNANVCPLPPDRTFSNIGFSTVRCDGSIVKEQPSDRVKSYRLRQRASAIGSRIRQEEKESNESRKVQICGQMKGIISTHFGDRRPFAFGLREKEKLDRRGEEGELRDKKAAASRFKLFLSLAQQGMDSALEDRSMASGGWLLRIAVRSTAAGWPWRSQAKLVVRALPRRVSARQR